MKYRNIATYLFALALGFGLLACEEDPLAPSEPTVEAEIDGTSWESTSVSTVKLSSQVQMTATGSNESLVISIMDYETTGDKNVPVAAVVAYTAPDGTVYTSTSGTVTLNATDGTTYEGDFDVTATNMDGESISITGTFDVTVNV